MRAIEVIVIVAMVMAFYALLAKSATFDMLPTPDITDLNSLRSEATDIYATVLTWIVGNSPVIAEQDPITMCEDAITQARTAEHKLIIIRLDDVQAWAWRDISIRITEDTLNRDIPITLGVIPKDSGTDQVLAGYLREKALDSRVEIAQHGTDHSEQEFVNLSRWEAIKLASSGKSELERAVGVAPVTFIPPENAYGDSTTSALSSLGFSVLSAGRDEYENDGKLQKVGYTTSMQKFGADGSTRLTTPSEILLDCENTSNPLSLCVIMIHPQDFAGKDGSIDESKYSSYTQLLDRLETGKYYLFATFRDLLACPQGQESATVETLSINPDLHENKPVKDTTVIQPTSDHSEASSNRCVDYNRTTNIVTVLCNSTFSSLAAQLVGENVLRNDGEGTYTLNSGLIVGDGATFGLRSTELSWLRLEDRSSITVYGRVEWEGVRITSWDSESNSVIESEDGTVFRGWIAFVESEGGFIRNSEISHLGYQSSVDNRSGFDLQSTHDMEITGSKFHHMYFAFYSNNIYNVRISGNEYHSNILYALDPHSGTRDIEITNNHVHDNKGFGIICSLDCHNILIERNVVHDNGNAGIMLSRNTTNSIVRYNTVYNHHGDDGIVVSQSSDNHIYGNTLTDNRQGIYVKTATSTGNVIEGNTIIGGDYGIVVATANAGNVARGNTIEGARLAEFYLLDGGSVLIDSTPIGKLRVDGGKGDNSIMIVNSGELFLFPTFYDTNAAPFVQSLSQSSIILRGGLEGPDTRDFFGSETYALLRTLFK
jgi:parallel beta-helix repeat protein